MTMTVDEALKWADYHDPFTAYDYVIDTAAMRVLAAEVTRLRADLAARDQRVRELLWLSCCHPAPSKYADDGEHQCAGFDFNRRSLEDCEHHVYNAMLERHLMESPVARKEGV